ncbi:MAG: SpoIIE family protein phosphatase [Dysgonamonadaceae bacterium]|jgi:sigma-B regulation protein RsbU (phosphoserine phosphatase)|nr:SpoIIE family protein phosphatase [Dysgonamonadaceae bacterium]
MAVKILSVDDEQDMEILLAQFFRRKIKRGEYEFTFARNGVEALQLLLAKPDFDIILSDINMPEMDGLTLLTKINEMRNPALKCIVVSAYGDMENIRTAMNRGAFDFTTKPINLEDMETTIEKAVEQINFVKKAQKEHLQLASIQSDLKVAGEIQQTILPKNFPPYPALKSFDIYASMKAAAYVGGDFYDFFLVDDEHLGFVIADVSGKGIPAAIFMAISRTVIRAIALAENSPAICMMRSNHILCKESVNDMFVTAFYGILNIQTGVVNYCNAGHNPPVFINKNAEPFFIPLTGDCILGAVPDLVFHSNRICLEAGDTILLYTDGVTEAMNGEKELFGNKRLLDKCRSLANLSPNDVIGNITKSIDEFTAENPLADDVTLLAINYNGCVKRISAI